MKNLIRFVLIFFLPMSLLIGCDNLIKSKNAPSKKQLTAPELLFPENQASQVPTNVELEWKKLANINKYDITVAKDSLFASVVADTQLESSSYVVSSLDFNSVYYWKVNPLQDGQLGASSSLWSFTTEMDTSGLVTTELLKPKEDQELNEAPIPFEWKPVDEAKEYKIQISTEPHFDQPIIDSTVTSSSAEISRLSDKSEYVWRVIPVLEEEKQDSSAWSETHSFLFNPVNDVNEPTTVQLISPDDNQTQVSTEAQLIWATDDEASEYQVQLAQNSDFSNPEIDQVTTDTTISPQNLTHQQTYYWRVSVVAPDDQKVWSQVRSFQTEALPVVELLSPNDTESQLPVNTQLNWVAADEFNEYAVQLASQDDFSEPALDTVVTNTSFELQNLDYEQNYYWRVSVVAPDDQKAWSQVRSFQTEALPVVELLSPNDTESQLPVNTQLNWVAADGFNEYAVQVARQDDFSEPALDTVVTNTSFELQNLDYEQNYYWRVSVVAPDDQKAWSQVWSFQTQTAPSPSPDQAYVTVENGDFMLDGKVFRYSGTNAYYLPNYEKINEQVVDRALDLFEDSGIKVVRMWAFYDGYDCGYSAEDPSENVIQTSPGNYSEEALQDLDNVIAKGKERGIRFILPFINFWDQLGGVCQYNTWAGASNPSTNMDFFLNNSDTQKWYRDYIEMLLNRVNTVTGVAYKNEPAIFAWQIMNEGRNRGADPEILRDWYQEIAQYIKSIDSNHLVTTGEEGFDSGTPPEYSESEYSNTYTLRANEGTSYIMNTSIPEIDFGNAHWYPTEYGFGHDFSDEMIRAQTAWIQDHQAIAESVGKPFIIGEYGYPGWGNEVTANFYDEFFERSQSTQLDGDLIWQLTADGAKCWEFGGNICYPDGRTDTEMYNAFRTHITNKTTIE